MAPTPPPDFMPAAMSACTNCGNNVPTLDEAQKRILELENQVRLLNAKAAAAVDRLADYEDEVRSLRTSYTRLQQQTQAQPQTPSPSLLPEQPPSSSLSPLAVSPPRNASRLASLSALFPGRKRDTAILQQPPNTPASALFPPQGHQGTPTLAPARSNTTDSFPSLDPSANLNEAGTSSLTLHSLQTSLETERTLRLRAESNLTQTQTELEELTATLFGQANEMVAQERKARAKLEERVKVLEDRDGEKRRRLDRLERALERIDRVRGLVRESERAAAEKEKEKHDYQMVVVGVVNESHGDSRERLQVVN